MKNFYLGLVKKMIKVIQLVIIRIKIMIKKEKDRINHIATTGAQTGNVFLAYRNVAEIDQVISKWQEEKKIKVLNL